MDLFALGTPVIDIFAKASRKDIEALGIEKGATNFFSEKKLGHIERMLAKKAMHRYPGDNARNVCEGFAAVGGFCCFAGAVGSDREGAEFSLNLQQCGIGSLLQEKKGRTGKIISLITPDGERTFCANLGVGEEYDGFDAIAAENARIFYASSITACSKKQVSKACLSYMKKFKSEGKMVAFAFESPPMVERNREMLISLAKEYADVVFLNEMEACALLGEKYLSLLPGFLRGSLVYLKMGKRGSALFYRGEMKKINAMRAKVVDTTGAGDAYCAGTLYGLSRGYSALSSGKIGCYLATKVVGKVGAGIPLRHLRGHMAYSFK